jgi:hypothetical protein
MKKNDHVQFTGKVPTKLKKLKGPIYGTVIKVTKQEVTVKPRYRRFEVVIAKSELTKIKDDVFTKKQKYPNGKPAPKKKAPVKTIPKLVKTKPKANESIKKVVAKAKEEVNKPSFKTDPAEKLTVPKMPEELPLNSPVMDKMPKKEEKEDFNWVKDDPINTPKPDIKTEMEDYLDDQKGGGIIIYVVIAIVLGLAIGSYLLFF